MEHLIFSLNATIPIFLVMVIGYILHRIKVVDAPFIKTLNSFNYKITLPVLLFKDIAESDFFEVWDTTYVLFCFFATLICIIVIWMLTALLYKDKDCVGEFVQGAYRSSAAVLGIAFIQNIYGTSGMAISACRISLPFIVTKTIGNISVLATPLALLGLGAGFEGKKALAKIKPTLICSLIKLLIQPLIFLPPAIQMGFRDEKLVALLVMLGAPTTVSCYIMAKNMKHEGTLTSSVVVCTTFFSSISLTLWLYLLRSLGLI